MESERSLKKEDVRHVGKILGRAGSFRGIDSGSESRACQVRNSWKRLDTFKVYRSRQPERRGEDGGRGTGAIWKGTLPSENIFKKVLVQASWAKM